VLSSRLQICRVG